ncbi:MAG TPA: ATP-binding cassette domain-containing protein, partial [Rugosimonospora sp.]|nr:ATP-binding cassette domain-containing protein [Rugosimonospora sp.]
MSDLRVTRPASMPAPSGAGTAAQGRELLRLDGVRVTYGGLVAVQGVDLTVNAGECVVILGPNGAGKTSLIGTVAGVVKPAG